MVSEDLLRIWEADLHMDSPRRSAIACWYDERINVCTDMCEDQSNICRICGHERHVL